MKTLDEFKQMNFIPHHECGCCGEMVGWYVCDGVPLFDTSCDCGSSLSRRDTWENVFKWYNTAFENESEEAVNAEWARYAAAESSPEEYRLECGSEAIYAGPVRSGVFERNNVTGAAVAAVAQWLVMKRITVSCVIDGKKYRMVVAEETN